MNFIKVVKDFLIWLFITTSLTSLVFLLLGLFDDYFVGIIVGCLAISLMACIDRQIEV